MMLFVCYEARAIVGNVLPTDNSVDQENISFTCTSQVNSEFTADCCNANADIDVLCPLTHATDSYG